MSHFSRHSSRLDSPLFSIRWPIQTDRRFICSLFRCESSASFSPHLYTHINTSFILSDKSQLNKKKTLLNASVINHLKYSAFISVESKPFHFVCRVLFSSSWCSLVMAIEWTCELLLRPLNSIGRVLIFVLISPLCSRMRTLMIYCTLNGTFFIGLSRIS